MERKGILGFVRASWNRTRSDTNTAVRSVRPDPADMFPPSYKIRFESGRTLEAALSMESPLSFPVQSAKRNFVLTSKPSGMSDDRFQGVLDGYRQQLNAVVTEDYRYDLDMSPFWDPDAIVSEAEARHDLDDVLKQIRAREAWNAVGEEGKEVVIAVVDTGIADVPEFPAWKRMNAWAAGKDDAWRDWNGHGTMCACIATATRNEGGRFDGVAPRAKLISCKTNFDDGQVAAIFDFLTGLARQGHRIIATNSFGKRTGSPPPPPEETDFPDALQEAIGAGVIAVFSAGNNHQLTENPVDGSPNSIWLHKSRADLLATSTCNMNQQIWDYSSRGPGQHHGEVWAGTKPDVSAPTPEYGKVLWGGEVVAMKNGWGTSGAAPQVAGLAALLLSARPDLPRDELFDIIRQTAVPLPHHRHAQGNGRINCEQAVHRLMAPPVSVGLS